jgi:hypothetical protein
MSMDNSKLSVRGWIVLAFAGGVLSAFAALMMLSPRPHCERFAVSDGPAASGITIDEAFEEVNSTFTLNGKPIDPFILEEFNLWQSDRGNPKTVSLDLLACFASNEYSFESEVSDGGFVKKERGKDLEMGYYLGFFGYRWYGRLSNGMHVVRTYDCGGGSGVFQDVMLLRIERAKGLGPGLKEYDRLLMTIMYSYGLYDSDSRELLVYDDYLMLTEPDEYMIKRFDLANDNKPKIIADFREK